MKNLSLLASLNTYAKIYTYTSLIHDEDDIVSIVTIDRQPSREAALKFTFDSLVGGVTIMIYGSLSSSAVNDTILVATGIAEAYRITSETFDTVTAMTASGFTSGEVSVEATEPDGSPIEKWSEVKEIRARLSRKGITSGVGIPGAVETTGFRMYALDDIAEGDIAFVSGMSYTVKRKVPRLDEFTGNISYYEFDVENIEGT